MTIRRINWEDGLKLDKNILLASDMLLTKNSNLANYLPLNIPKGIFNFTLANDALKAGLISIKSLTLYLDNRKFIDFDNSYPLAYQVTNNEFANTVNIYINIHNSVSEEDGIKILIEKLSLSNEYDHTANYSTQIARFRNNNTILDPDDYDYPTLSMNHYLMDSIFAKVNLAISNLKIFNKFIFSTSRPYASTYLSFLILRLERQILFAETNKSMVEPYKIYETIHDVYSIITSNILETSHSSPYDIIEFNVHKAFSSLDTLVSKLLRLCENKNLKNFVQFKLQGQKYICDDFPKEFFIAKNYYIVVKQKLDMEIKKNFSNKDKLRITSLSRYTNIITLSLSGLKLEEINLGLHSHLAISLNDYDTVFDIKKNAEWDFILVDKTAVFSKHEGDENYDFYIAFV